MAITLIIECEKRPSAAAGSSALGFLVRSVLKMCVFMSPGRLSWLHKIELVISNISSPKGACVCACVRVCACVCLRGDGGQRGA